MKKKIVAEAAVKCQLAESVDDAGRDRNGFIADLSDMFNKSPPSFL